MSHLSDAVCPPTGATSLALADPPAVVTSLTLVDPPAPGGLAGRPGRQSTN